MGKRKAHEEEEEVVEPSIVKRTRSSGLPPEHYVPLQGAPEEKTPQRKSINGSNRRTTRQEAVDSSKTASSSRSRQGSSFTRQLGMQ